MSKDNVPQKSYVLTYLSVTSPKPLEAVELVVNGSAVESEWQRSQDGGLHRAITDLSATQLGGSISRFSLLIHSSRFWIKREQKILVDIAEHLSMVQINDGQTYKISKKYKKNAVVTITVQQKPTALGSVYLRPTTEEITSSCPRFRILVIGNSGVGKSSLINMIFGLTGKEDTPAKVSALHVGEADINKEIEPSENVRLVLHDSLGFEGGENDNVETVVRFIQSRNEEPKLQDKLHAVWLCIQIPSSGGAVVEAGVEKLLKRKADGELGDLPFVVVFTQYDTLIDQVEYDLTEGGDGEAQMNTNALKSATVSENADELFLVNCLRPFEEKAGTKFPYSRVSTAEGYENTVHGLVKLTVARLESALPLEPYITSVMAQRFSPKIKIQGSIDVGKKRYWNSLVWGTIFKGKTLKDCLDVIHADIVAIWNFNDPRCHLRSSEFHLLMYDMVHSFSKVPQTSKSATKTLSVGLSMVATIAGIMTAVAGPAAPIVVPIAASVVLLAWAYEAYKESDDTLRRLMAYILDLTFVMQILFWIVQAKKSPDPITIRMVELAFRAHKESLDCAQVHKEIEDFVIRTNPVHRAKRENMIRQVEELLRTHTIEEEAGVRTLLGDELETLDHTVGEGGLERWSKSDSR